MIDRKDDEAFWPSYVDLMTSLFIVVLVLFIFSYAAYSVARKKLEDEKEQYRVDAERAQRLEKIDAAITELANGEEFRYDETLKRYEFRQEVYFGKGEYTIAPSNANVRFLTESGKAIELLVRKLKSDRLTTEDSSKTDVRYLVIIEGMASKDSYPDNFRLSYQRAYSLYKFWKEHNIVFDPDVCEIIIAGSGIEGVGRDIDESKNQRFLIQIVPKVSYRPENHPSRMSAIRTKMSGAY